MFTVYLLVAVAGAAHARLLHSLPEDTHAFPKYNVLFLNNLPVLNHTAQLWLQQPPSVSEFLGLEPGDASSSTSSLELLKMGPRDSYLCLIPEPLQLPPLPDEIPDDVALTPAHSWSLLQPLTGTCLYHRQGWFTYSYCHNNQIRQFKELIQPHSHIPEEDPSWESYTLGKAPSAELSVAQQQNENANALELARGAGSRYLVQRWTDGTICDKTGKGREVEVQFHCSMAMSDTVLFVKEVKTCSYVLVINTPRLCGEPGFKSHRDVHEQAHIRCREIVNQISQDYYSVPDTDHPQKIPKKTKSLPSAIPGTNKHKSNLQEQQHGQPPIDAVLRKALEVVLGNRLQGQTPMIIQDLSDDGEVIIELPDDVEDETLDEIVDALQVAGITLERQGDADDEDTSEKA
ncbi:hypothetical protein K435DRAFT_842873 [Dendrothele bispora CBS 962.96]|uniref:Protein OS-9 homolog n=1 Tax=Dendrothele bispora (strain CBS 962.96) TaxID=1314807 RepID=A0A4S8LBZ8_DENBC|nr:hypothetical protein K435DRAFT_842873 [Dendrothele bispora CBS 962.96]